MSLGRDRSKRIKPRHGGAFVPPRSQYKGGHTEPVMALGPDEDGVVCPDCGTKVAALKSGRPRSHAPGGLVVSIKRQQFKCPSSGTPDR